MLSTVQRLAAARKEAVWFHCCFQHGVNSLSQSLEELFTLALVAACQFNEIWFWMQKPTILILSEAAADKMLSFLWIWARRGHSLPFPATAPGNVMFPVLPSAWQVHLVSVSLQTPGSSWRHLHASHSLCLSILIIPAQHSHAGQVAFSLPRPTQAPCIICYLQTPPILGKSENLKLIFPF